MLKKFLVLMAVFAFFIGSAYAQSGSGSFQQGQNSWRRQGTGQFALVSNYSRKLSSAALNNILNAELVFCYNVGAASGNYNGYTLDGFAIKGFCGVIQDELKNLLLEQLFGTPQNVNFNAVEQCSINPRIVLRFIRGVDYTDVMLSSPCSSMAVFYAGKVDVFNFSPADLLMEAIAKSFDNTSMGFSSPAALNQVVPIGFSSNARTSSTADKARNVFESGASSSGRNNRAAGGWNNLK